MAESPIHLIRLFIKKTSIKSEEKFYSRKLPADAEEPDYWQIFIDAGINFFKAEAVDRKNDEKHPQQIHHIVRSHVMGGKHKARKNQIEANPQGNSVARRYLLQPVLARYQVEQYKTKANIDKNDNAAAVERKETEKGTC